MIKIVPIGTSAFISTGMKKQRTVRILGRLGEGVRDEEFLSTNVRLNSQWSGNRVTASMECRNNVFISFVKLELQFRTPRNNSLLSTWTESYSSTEKISSIKNCPGTISRAIKRTGAWAMWISETQEAEGMLFHQSPPVDYPILFSCNKIARTLSIKWVINRRFQKDEQLSLPKVDILRGTAQALIAQWRNLWKPSIDRRLAPNICSSWCTAEEIRQPEQVQSTLTALRNSGISMDCFVLGPNYVSETGDWLEPGEVFREKMGQITRSISEAHMVPGIRFAPFLVSRKSSLAMQNPEWLVHNANGSFLKVDSYENQSACVLDITKPQVLEHIREMMTTIRDRWGFRAFILERIGDVATRGVRDNARICPGQLIRIATKSVRNALGNKIFITAGDIPLLCALDSVNSRINTTSFAVNGHSNPQKTRNKILMNTVITLHRSEWNNVGWLCASGLFPANLMDVRGNDAITSLGKAIQLSCNQVLLGGKPESLSRNSTERLMALLKQNSRKRRGSIKQLSYSHQLDKTPLILKNNQGNIGVFNLSKHVQKVILDKDNIRRTLDVPSNLKVDDTVVLNSPEIHVFIPPLGSRIFTL